MVSGLSTKINETNPCNPPPICYNTPMKTITTTSCQPPSLVNVLCITLRDASGKSIHTSYPNNIGRTTRELYMLAKEEGQGVSGATIETIYKKTS